MTARVATHSETYWCKGGGWLVRMVDISYTTLHKGGHPLDHLIRVIIVYITNDHSIATIFTNESLPYLGVNLNFHECCIAH